MYGFRDLHLHKLMAGYYGSNLGSARVLSSNGFKLEGISKNLVMLSNGEWDDAVRVGLLEEEYKEITDGKCRC
jgi:RimJ/RimL family protein N-acetyltransferase